MTPETEAYLRKCERALADMGGTHSFDDIMQAINSGHMQSFAKGNTWAVTQILEMPQKRLLEIVLVVGDMEEARELHDVVVAYGRSKGCDLVRTFARDGWTPDAKQNGWTTGHRVFLKDLSHGNGRRRPEPERNEAGDAPAVG